MAAAPDGVYLYRLYVAIVGFRGEDGRASEGGRQERANWYSECRMVWIQILTSENTREPWLYTNTRVNIMTMFPKFFCIFMF